MYNFLHTVSETKKLKKIVRSSSKFPNIQISKYNNHNNIWEIWLYSVYKYYDDNNVIMTICSDDDNYVKE